MPTMMRFSRDGTVYHMHPVRGSVNSQGRWHWPWERHPRDINAHSRENVESPYIRLANRRHPVPWEDRYLTLTEDQIGAYYRALNTRAYSIVPGVFVSTPVILEPDVISVPVTPISERRFGVEMECITNTNAFTEACRRRGITVLSRGYSHVTPSHNTWMLTPDGSLSYTGRREGFRTIEVVSPILKGQAGMEALKKVCEAHAEVGTIVNRTCGLHVHHDATALTLGQAKRIAHSYSNVQGIIDSLVAPSRRANNAYCGRLSPGDLRNIDAAITIGNMANNMGRYKNVNIGHAYHTHKTIEFRQHQGTVDYDKIAAWITLGQHIFGHVVNGQTLQPTENIDEMCTALGLPDDVCVYLKERKLKLDSGEF